MLRPPARGSTLRDAGRPACAGGHADAFRVASHVASRGLGDRCLLGWRIRSFGAWLGRVLVALLLLLAGGATAGLRVQHTASLPRGLYRVVRATSLEAIAGRGAIGVWCLADSTARWARARGYLQPGTCSSGTEPVAKTILATRGDTVEFDAIGLRAHGQRLANTAAPRRDALGRQLTPVRYGRYVLRADEVWVWSPYTARSFDSRYYGTLRTGALVAIVRPVWTP